MADVIRQDVVQINMEIDGLKEIKKLQDEINDLKKRLTGGVGEDALNQVGENAQKSVPPLEKVNKKAKDVTKSVTDIGKKGATAAFNGLKKVAGISFKALSAGIGASATAIGFLVKNSVSAYADFEQLFGGVETLLGAKGAKSVEEYAKLTGKSVSEVKGEYSKLMESQNLVMKNANNAFKEAGLSANDYMNTVTGFSASLLQSVGGDTVEAAKLADLAVKDMSDNANKMGTDMGSIQFAYQGFAKQNYTMLDNLKLGYGGTKTEMQRLVKDAAKLDKSIDANSLSYGNIVKAIHAVQVQTGIYGTTQKEAEHTITGSLNMVRSAWGNLMPALIQGGDTFDQCLENLIYAVDKFSDNIMPAMEKSLTGVGTLIEKLAPKFAEKFPELAEKLLPPLIRAAISLTQGLIKALPSIIKTVATTIVDIFGEQFPIIGEIFDFFKDNAAKVANAIKKIIPVVIALAVAFKMFKGAQAISSLFGKLGKGGGEKGGIFGAFESLANTKTSTVLKGMANLAIILGGFTILAAAFMAVAPYMAKLTDMKSVFKVILVVGSLGLLATGLAKLGEIVGKISVKTVALGLANMAIMLVGMTALTAAFMLVAPFIAELSKSGAVFKVMGVMLALGALGTALSIFAGIVGVIPVPTVLLGLANMAIVLTAFTALTAAFMYVAPSIAALSSSGAVFKVMGIMLVLGALGTVLTGFAGICGVVPIPVVLAGLANMGLVIGGISALIVAFGALSQIQGFNEFITKGGETLSQIFGIIGKVAGSLVGGFGEALSNSLPKIGENLAQFGNNIKPLFEAMSGVDMGGVGAFFTSLVGLLAIATGNEIVEGIKSLFGNEESALSKLGADLSEFATQSQGFFNIVSTLPDNGFTNGTKLFECLAGVKGLPSEGGIIGWFTGNISYTSLANGLGELSSDKVVRFFNTVSNLKQESFDNATKLFECLAGVKSLPSDGGVAQWFTGTIDYSKLASGLGDLSGSNAQRFFNMCGSLSAQTFENVKLLFKSLASIGDLPKEGGIAQWFTGSNDLGNIAEDLKEFSDTAEGFFKQVNSLNLGKLNGLWDALKKPQEITTDISKTVSDTINDIVNKVSELPQKMGDSIKKSGSSLKEALVQIWKDAVTATAAPVNKLIEGANWILKEFGSDKQLVTWTPYAKGTNGHKGGNALVNDGRGAEMVQMPNGNTFIPRGKNVFIPNAPKGMKVLSAENTAQAMGRKTPTFRYADGTDDIDVWSYIDNANGLINRVVDKFVNYDGTSGISRDISKGMVKTIQSKMTAWVEKLFDEMGGMSLEGYNPSKGVEQWRATVIRALKMEGQYSAANVARTLYQMQTESGGNPRAINLWDSNAKKGIPSKGLMQCIDPTFKAYARAGYDKNIYDPLSNILASIRYAVSRYGSLARAYQGHGYANGGIVKKPHFGLVGEAGEEAIIPLSNSKRKRGLELWSEAGEEMGVTVRTPANSAARSQVSNTEYNTYSPVFNLTISGAEDERTMERKVKTWVKEAMQDVFDGVTRRNPRIKER